MEPNGMESIGKTLCEIYIYIILYTCMWVANGADLIKALQEGRQK